LLSPRHKTPGIADALEPLPLPLCGFGFQRFYAGDEAPVAGADALDVAGPLFGFEAKLAQRRWLALAILPRLPFLIWRPVKSTNSMYWRLFIASRAKVSLLKTAIPKRTPAMGISGAPLLQVDGTSALHAHRLLEAPVNTSPQTSSPEPVRDLKPTDLDLHSQDAHLPLPKSLSNQTTGIGALLAEQAGRGQSIEWSPMLSIGIASIDAQHRVLVAYINQLTHAVANGQTARILPAVLAGLEGYTRIHFRHEERLFALHGWTEQTDHADGHRAFERQLAEFRRRFENGDTSMGLEVLKFMIHWLAGHILSDDMAYSAFLRDHGVR
jgi:hemerythrin-like metal-binding protein